MSAYMCDKEHIDAIVAVVDCGPSRGCDPKATPWHDAIRWSGILPEVAEPLTELGKILVAENLKSIQSRYPDVIAAPEDTPGPCERYWESGYIYSQSQRIPSLVEALKLIDCYEYQSCEHDGWKASRACEIMRRLTSILITYLPGYEAAPWGWPE